MTSEKRGQFVDYRQVGGNLVDMLNGFFQDACPVSRPRERERAAHAAGRDGPATLMQAERPA